MKTKIITFFYVCFSCNAVCAENPWLDGIWKSPPPPRNADAEFEKQDPYGLSIGVHIPTDCSIWLVRNENGKPYFFNSLTSKSFFLGNPDKCIRAAETFLATQHKLESETESQVNR